MSEPRAAESVAGRLRFLRGSLGLSQEQLARRLGVSFATVNRWESGRTQLSARALTALAELEAEVAGATADNSSSRDSSSEGRVRSTASHGISSSRGGDITSSSASDSTSSRPGDSTSSPADLLPVARSSFIGRNHELAELTALLRQSRLVTLIGPGGAGKTRLATEVLTRSFADADIVFVPLEQVRDPRALASALASRLRVHDQPGTPLIESIRGALATSPRLLLLDGAERLADLVAELTGVLLASAPEVKVIVTSRIVLGVPGEVCWTVPPLACPSVTAGASDIAGSDAVQLFIARASERLPDFRASDVAPHAIAELCRRLDGLPLAIELIAGWVGTLSIREILQQRSVLLDSAPAQVGQRGGRRLADVLQVSYDLLAPDQQRRLAMLSVFGGSFRLDDIQAVLGIDPLTAVATTRLLVDSSWLVVTRGLEQNLFSMLETIRTFAALQLEKTPDGAAARRRHALHWASIAADSEQGLGGPDAASWTRRLEVAVTDLHLALHWADEHSDVDLGLDISASLWRWWLVSGRLSVGRNWLARFLAQAGERDDELVGRALCSAAVLAAENGDYPEAIRTAESAMAIFEPLGLKLRMTLAATVLGSANRYLGNTEAARLSFQTAMRLREELGDRRGMSLAINNMALLELDAGNTGQARELIEQALAIKREFGDPRSIAIGLANLADVLMRTGEWEAAERALHEGAGMAGGDPHLIGTIRCNQGALAAHQEDWAVAAEHFRAAIAASPEGGHPQNVIEAMIGLGRVCHRTGQHEEALRQLRGAQDLAANTGNAQRLGEAKAALAEITGDAKPDSPAPAEPVRARRPGNLTARQAEVLRLLAAGLSNKQIAAELYVSAATVERHLATIYRNLGLAGRVEAARFAFDHGLADPA